MKSRASMTMPRYSGGRDEHRSAVGWAESSKPNNPTLPRLLGFEDSAQPTALSPTYECSFIKMMVVARRKRLPSRETPTRRMKVLMR